MTPATGASTCAASMTRCLGVAMLIGGTGLLGACATSRPTPAARVETTVPLRSASAIAFERRLEESAAHAERQGRLADEATALELLAILRPEEPALEARRQALGERIGKSTQDRLRRGAEAFRRGLLDIATSQYLAALALSPDNEIAANALRAIERERNRRTLLTRQTERLANPLPASGD